MTLDPKALEAAMQDVKRFRFRTDSTIDDFVFMTAQAAITAYLHKRKAQGFVEVPVEPTPEMIEAGFYPATQKRGAKSVWGCMLAARPQKETDQ